MDVYVMESKKNINSRRLTIEELKERELQILIKFHEFCNKNNLKYWLTAGSLIGAVRHKGFIPWDDDIDVAMPREDYMKLIRIFPQEGLNGIKLLSPYTVSDCPITFGKLYEVDSLKLDREVKKKYWKYGLDIDIFPWDYAPSNENELNKFYRGQYLRFKLFLGIVGKIRKEKNIIKTVIKAIFMGMCKILAVLHILNANKIALSMNKKAMSFPKNNCLCSSMQPSGMKVKGYAKTSCFDELILSNFEDEKFFIPVGYDQILRSSYGNYMEFPPEEKRVTHHLSDVFLKKKMIKEIGIISYNIYCNFTNYGSALQTWALYQTINRLGNGKWESILVDYCPDILLDKDPLNPFKNMWDKDAESRKMCELSLPAIRENFEKFDSFYKERFHRTKQKYTSKNFNDIILNEKIDGFVCGSDTIFCIDEFGFDDGYYANYGCMQGKSVAYAASFGDSHFDSCSYSTLNNLLQNFKAIGLRERQMLPYVSDKVQVPTEKVIDPTLLLTCEDYDTIASERLVKEKYILLYSRRYNPAMEEYTEKLATENGWKIVEISLRATNADKGHIMFYNAGVEEFLSLVKYAEFVVTNSFHGMIFSVQYSRPLTIFSREQCDTKIDELLELFGLSYRKMITGNENRIKEIDYKEVHQRIEEARNLSLKFLKKELEIL
jgi:phosphorylcholine metabolism protein LicD